MSSRYSLWQGHSHPEKNASMHDITKWKEPSQSLMDYVTPLALILGQREIKFDLIHFSPNILYWFISDSFITVHDSEYDVRITERIQFLCLWTTYRDMTKAEQLVADVNLQIPINITCIELNNMQSMIYRCCP